MKLGLIVWLFLCVGSMIYPTLSEARKDGNDKKDKVALTCSCAEHNITWFCDANTQSCGCPNGAPNHCCMSSGGKSIEERRKYVEAVVANTGSGGLSGTSGTGIGGSGSVTGQTAAQQAAAAAAILAAMNMPAFPKAPNLKYPTNGICGTAGCYFRVNKSGSSIVPTNSGGKITDCTVSAALPAGLSIAKLTCVISGTPTASYSGWKSFTVTAKSGALTQTKTIKINVAK